MTTLLNKPSRSELEEVVKELTAGMLAAASAYKTYGRKYKTRGPSDPFYTKRLQDFEITAERGRDLCLRIFESEGK